MPEEMRGLFQRGIGKDQATVAGIDDDVIGQPVDAGLGDRHGAIVLAIEARDHTRSVLEWAENNVELA